MDVFPSVMEYLGLEFKSDWDLDGRSRIEWQSPPKSCDCSNTKPSIALSGGYIFNAADSGSLNTNLVLDECLSDTTDLGTFHYPLWSPCVATDGNASTS